MQGMAGVMRNAVIRHEKQLAENTWNNINQRTFPHSRCSTKILKLILLLHDTDFNLLDGEQVIFRHKSLGAGVHDVWMERSCIK